MTTELLDLPLFRVRVAAAAETGLRQESEAMIDKIQPARRDKVQGPVGRIDADAAAALSDGIALFMGLAD